jgi:pyrroloquinoline quinone biosynthesis protein D
VPLLRRGVRLREDTDGSTLLLVPEGILRLNETAAATLALVDGVRSVDAIVDALSARYAVARDDVMRDVEDLIGRLTLRGYLTS